MTTLRWRGLTLTPAAQLWGLAGAAGVLSLLLVFLAPVMAALFAAAAGVFGTLAAKPSGEAPARLAPAPSATQSMGLAELAPLLEAMPDPALLIDENGRIAGSNQAARRDLKFEAAGLFLSSILRHPALLDAVQAASHDGATRTVEYSTALQVEEHTRCYVAPLDWGKGKAALVVFHDQTARMNTERMRADFLANASHELRTPLASLTLLIETIAGPARDDIAQRDRFLTMMQVQADRMRRLIDDLLSLSRIELDEHVPPSDRADLAQVARETVDILNPGAELAGVRLSLRGAEAPALVVGERFQLAQVVQNLVDNAVKYTPKGGVVEIELGQAEGREDVLAKAGRRWPEAGRVALLTPAYAPDIVYTYIRVADAGPGVQRRFLPRLGERFFRVERELGNEKGGTGLGLAIVKHIVNRHRGGLAVESEPGRGSAFLAYVERAGDETTP